MGGLDRIATVVKSDPRRRGQDKLLLLDGGDTWTNSWTSLQTQGQDMVDVMNLLKPDAMTGHWEFTLGDARVKEIADKLPFPFLAQNIRDNEFEDPVFPRLQDVRARRREDRRDRPGASRSRRSPIRAG